MGSIPTRSRHNEPDGSPSELDEWRRKGRTLFSLLVFVWATVWVSSASWVSAASMPGSPPEAGLEPRNEESSEYSASQPGKPDRASRFASSFSDAERVLDQQVPADPAEPEPDDDLSDETDGVDETEAGEDDRFPEGVEGETVRPGVTEPGQPWHQRPSAIMARSLVVPGWGQWTNGKRVKSAVVAGTEGYLIYRALRARSKEQEARDNFARADSTTTIDWEATADNWNEEKRDYAWWTLFVVILSVGDAYVDAHLRGFETEFEPLNGTAEIRWSWKFD